MKKMSNFVAMSLVLALLMTGCSGKIKEKKFTGILVQRWERRCIIHFV